MRRTLAIVIVLLLCAGAARAQTVRTLQQFDAGTTVRLKVGEDFQIQLERQEGETKVWRWPIVDDHVIRVAAPPTETRAKERPGVVIETHSFRAVAPGTTNLYAELVDAANPTKVFARFPVTVQVVTSPAAEVKGAQSNLLVR